MQFATIAPVITGSHQVSRETITVIPSRAMEGFAG
jgi:hypothetical protein